MQHKNMLIYPKDNHFYEHILKNLNVHLMQHNDMYFYPKDNHFHEHIFNKFKKPFSDALLQIKYLLLLFSVENNISNSSKKGKS